MAGYELICVITISLMAGVINILHIIIGAAKTQPGFTYLGVGHFYLDYFEYLQQIVQGMRGRWSVINQFTINDPTQTIFGWEQYLLIGKWGKIFNFSPIFTYWFSVFILTFILSFLIFLIIKEILKEYSFVIQFFSFVLTLLIAPLVKITWEMGKIKIIPFDFWYAPISFFHRFGGIPHHLLASILTILVMILTAQLLERKKIELKKFGLKTSLIILILAALLTFAPFQVINLMSAIVFVTIINQIRLFRLNTWFLPILVIVVIFPLALVIKHSHDLSPLFIRAIAWEKIQQHHPPLLLILATVGPIIFFVPFGLKTYFKKITQLKLLLFAYFIFSYTYFFSPLAEFFGTFNLRFLTPVVYVFYGVVGFLGVMNFVKIIETGWIRKMIITLIFVYCFTIQIIIFSSFSVDRLSYIPNGVMEAFTFLNKQKDNKSVLTAPDMSLGVILPSYADKNVYLGRTIFTPDFENKSNISDRFFKGVMSIEEANVLLKENNIGYVILTSMENYLPGSLKNYSLKEIYKNKDATVWEVN